MTASFRFPYFRRGVHACNRYLVLAFIAAAGILAPIHASALSVNDFQKETAQQQGDSYTKAVQEATSEAFKVSIKVGRAVGNYFTVIPPGASLPKGYTAFDAELRDVLQDAKSGKADLDKISIEAIIADVIQTDVLPNIPPNPPPPTSP